MKIKILVYIFIFSLFLNLTLSAEETSVFSNDIYEGDSIKVGNQEFKVLLNVNQDKIIAKSIYTSLTVDVEDCEKKDGVKICFNSIDLLRQKSRINIDAYLVTCEKEYIIGNETKCKVNYGYSCESDIECNNGFCVHNTCTPTSPFCGDNFCDNEELSCFKDCIKLNVTEEVNKTEEVNISKEEINLTNKTAEDTIIVDVTKPKEEIDETKTWFSKLETRNILNIIILLSLVIIFFLVYHKIKFKI